MHTASISMNKQWQSSLEWYTYYKFLTAYTMYSVDTYTRTHFIHYHCHENEKTRTAQELRLHIFKSHRSMTGVPWFWNLAKVKRTFYGFYHRDWITNKNHSCQIVDAKYILSAWQRCLFFVYQAKRMGVLFFWISSYRNNSQSFDVNSIFYPSIHPSIVINQKPNLFNS